MENTARLHLHKCKDNSTIKKITSVLAEYTELGKTIVSNIYSYSIHKIYLFSFKHMINVEHIESNNYQ